MFDFIINLYKKHIWSLEKQAKEAGVKMGSSNLISSRFWGSEPYLISIGSHCQITKGVKLLTHGGGSVVRRWHSNFDAFGKVSIGDYVYIGTNSLIMPGVTIDDNVLIAAGSIVTKSIPANMVVAGIPAKIVCTIEEYYNKNKQYDIGTKGLNNSDKKKILLELSDDKFIKKGYLKR